MSPPARTQGSVAGAPASENPVSENAAGSPVYVVDAFTDRAYAGNPAAVCVLDAPAAEPWMRAVAREMNLSETAFAVPRSGGFDLRWFTPTIEVDLCGHATLACAHVLWETGRLAPAETAHFHTRGGPLSVRRGAGGLILRLPRRDAVPLPPSPGSPTRLPPGLAALLPSPVRHVALAATGLLVELHDEAAVRAFVPDFAALAAIPPGSFLLTAPADGDDFDVVSRYFAPAFGVGEDPVTGSAHATLAAYWAARLGRTRLRAWQASARGGGLSMELLDDAVELTGRAVTVLRGHLLA